MAANGKDKMEDVEVGESTRLEDVIGEEDKMELAEIDEEEEIDKIFELAVDLTRVSLGWSTEGTEGLGDRVQRVAAPCRANLLKRTNSTKYDSSCELQLLINFESAVITFGKNPHKRMAIINDIIPGFPPFNALGALKIWLHNLEDGVFSTTEEAHAAFKEASKLRNPYPVWMQVLGTALLSMAFAIDVNANWEASIVALLFGIVGGLAYQATEWGRTWALFMAFIVAFLVSFPICLLYRYGVVEQSPGLLMICPLFLFIPGDTITTQAIEILSGQWSNGVARLFYALIQLVLLGFGALLGVLVTGYDQDVLDPDDSTNDFPIWYAKAGSQ